MKKIDGPGLDVWCFVMSQRWPWCLQPRPEVAISKLTLHFMYWHCTSEVLIKNTIRRPMFCCKLHVVQYSALCGMATSPMVVWGARETCCAVFERPTTPTPSYHCRTGTKRIPQIRSKETSLVFPVSRGEPLCSQENNGVWGKIKSVCWARQCQLEKVLRQVLPVRIWRLCPWCLDAHRCDAVRLPDHFLHG